MMKTIEYLFLAISIASAYLLLVRIKRSHEDVVWCDGYRFARSKLAHGHVIKPHERGEGVYAAGSPLRKNTALGTLHCIPLWPITRTCVGCSTPTTSCKRAFAEVNRQTAIAASAESRMHAKMGACAEAIRSVKFWKKRAEKAEKPNQAAKCSPARASPSRCRIQAQHAQTAGRPNRGFSPSRAWAT